MMSSGGKTRNNFVLDIANDEVDGYKSVNKFGAAINGLQTTVTDIWDRADDIPTQQLWVPPTAARIHSFVSTSASDTSAGVGARVVRVFGLKTWDTKETYEDVTMLGTTPVNTVNSYVIIHRMRVISYGDNGPNVGDITATAATDGTVTAQITEDQGQTLMAIYGVPSTQNAFMTNFYFDLHDIANPSQASVATYRLLTCESPDNFDNTFIVKHTGGALSSGNSSPRHIFSPYKKFDGPCIIKIQGFGSASDFYASAGFDLILKDK